MKKVEFARMMPGVLMAYDINKISYDTMPGVLMATMRCDMREDRVGRLVNLYSVVKLIVFQTPAHGRA